MSMLAVSTQKDQAVATSTLFLWRSLGSVIGVASGSLIVQNFLKWGLGMYVDGSAFGKTREEDLEVMDRVRKSVDAVAGLEEGYRNQVVRAYELALKGAFWWAVLAAVVGVCLALCVRVPALRGIGEYRRVEELDEEREEEERMRSK